MYLLHNLLAVKVVLFKSFILIIILFSKALMSDQSHTTLHSLGQLAGGMAHELNNLLQPILTFSRLLLDRTDVADKETRDDLHMILTSARQAKSIVGDVLLFARGDTATHKVIDMPYEMHDKVEAVTKLLPSTVIVEKKIAKSSTPLARLSNGDMTQLLSNLMVNASKAMNGVGKITVNYHVTDDKVWHEITIADTGPGIDQAIAAHIFQPFFTTRAIGEGTGLGLTIVQGIVVRAGGTLDFSSLPGCGTTFRLRFPVLKLRT
jgi:signal transduction histidine kinase